MKKMVSVAPMMDCTDRHDRYFLRLISKNVKLYTEMIVSNAIVKGQWDKDWYKSMHASDYFELDSDTLEKGLFNNRDFEKVFLEDIKKAKQSIAIFSGFIT